MTFGRVFSSHPLPLRYSASVLQRRRLVFLLLLPLLLMLFLLLHHRCLIGRLLNGHPQFHDNNKASSELISSHMAAGEGRAENRLCVLNKKSIKVSYQSIAIPEGHINEQAHLLTRPPGDGQTSGRMIGRILHLFLQGFYSSRGRYPGLHLISSSLALLFWLFISFKG